MQFERKYNLNEIEILPKWRSDPCTQERCLLMLLRIRSAHLEYSDFLLVMLTDTLIFLQGLKLSGGSIS